jgi:hypothetical protein
MEIDFVKLCNTVMLIILSRDGFPETSSGQAVPRYDAREMSRPSEMEYRVKLDEADGLIVIDSLRH